MFSGDATIVIPCYNEAVRLDQAAIISALDEMPWLRFCLVDDGSTDNTAALLVELQQRAPDRIDVLHLGRNCGKAEAVRRGLLRVCTSYSGATPALCGFWDADLSAPLSELALLAAAFEAEPAIEWVWAIRLRALGRTITRGALRHYLGRAFATATSLVLGLGAYDTQCGAKLFRVTPLLLDVISEPFLSRWVFDVEMLSRADALLRSDGGRRVADIVYEQPLRAWHHRAGSKVRPLDFVRASLELLRIRGGTRRWARPISQQPSSRSPVLPRVG